MATNWVVEFELDYVDQIIEFPDEVGPNRVTELSREGLTRRLASDQMFLIRKIMDDGGKGPWIKATPRPLA